MSTPVEYARSHGEAFRRELSELLRIPSISTDPAYDEAIGRAAGWLVDHFRTLGLEAQSVPTAHHPVVYAEWNGAGKRAPTVLVYGHYDVQPAAREEGWKHDPFDPVEEDGRIWARGATDDKGQMFAHVKAVESYLKAVGEIPINVKFVIEGEEECASPSFEGFLQDNRDRLRADLCVISDSPMESIDRPVIISSLRGGSVMKLVVRGPSRDLHSGGYGGSVHNPAQAIAEIIAQLHGEDGKVSVPGFYDGVRSLTDEEGLSVAEKELSLDKWRKETGAPEPWGESAYSLKERVTVRPTLEITGLAGGYLGEGLKAIIPAEARATLICRLVFDQDPRNVFERVRDYVAEITPPTVRSEVIYIAGAPACVVDTRHPAMEAAVRAYQRGWGATPTFVRSGAGIPVVTGLRSILRLPVILMGFGLLSDNLHAPNEHLSIEMFRRGVETSIVFLEEAARWHPPAS